MAHLEALDPKNLPEWAEQFAHFEAQMGFIPNTLLTMLRRPTLAKAFAGLRHAALYDPECRVPIPIKHCIAFIASQAAGCQYCAAHNASNASRWGISAEKVDALWDYERSPLFSEAERAAMAFAQSAALVPNAVTADDFVRLRKFYDEEQIIEILAVVAYFGFLNRWNDTLATDLEGPAAEFAKTHLKKAGWRPGKHVKA